jgi:hypothetical protein
MSDSSLPALSDHSWKRRLFSLVALLGRVAALDGVSRIFGILAGILAVQALSKHDYAYFSLTIALTIALEQILNGGASQSLVGLIGRDAANKEIVLRCIGAGLRLRAIAMPLAVVVALAAVPLLYLRQGFTVAQSAFAAIALVGVLYFQGYRVCTQTLFVVWHKLTPMYRILILGSGVRLSLIGALVATGHASGWSLLATSLIEAAIGGICMKRAATRELGARLLPDGDRLRELWRLVAPQWLAILYFAILPQVQVFLVSIFGNTTSIAEVAALGRINQIVIIPTMLFPVLLAPRLAQAEMRRFYLIIVAVALGTGTFGLMMLGLAWSFPESLLWLIGKGYATLQVELRLSILAACIVIMISLLDCACVARNWVYHWYSVALIVMTLLVQVAYVHFVPMNSTMGAIGFGVALGVSILLLQMVRFLWGVRSLSRSL